MKQCLSRLMLEYLLIKRAIFKTSLCGSCPRLKSPAALPEAILVVAFLLAVFLSLSTPFFLLCLFYAFFVIQCVQNEYSSILTPVMLQERRARIFHFVQREVISQSLVFLYNILVFVFFQDSNVKLIKELQLEIRSLKKTLKVQC